MRVLSKRWWPWLAVAAVGLAAALLAPRLAGELTVGAPVTTDATREPAVFAPETTESTAGNRGFSDWRTLPKSEWQSYYGVQVDCFGPPPGTYPFIPWSDYIVVARVAEVGARRFQTVSGEPPLDLSDVDDLEERTYFPLRMEVVEALASRRAEVPNGFTTWIPYERFGLDRPRATPPFVGATGLGLEVPRIRPEVLYDHPVGVVFAAVRPDQYWPASQYARTWADTLSHRGASYEAVDMFEWYEYI